ncbi:hypothetical protein ColLi_09219 [Colletotrichum liriopes]|uniref:Uncharacterized protein n=1 Tax=Colletotrichum liriopes TaxID=708192 RepID=A0AA37LW48_9PEZI|nr:hypothetical protein ColLi_09219 [Colletotrichum liriopes]
MTTVQFLFAIFAVPSRPLLKHALATYAFATVKLTIFGQELYKKAAVHACVSPVFLVVTTGLNQLMCDDPAMVHNILSHRREFVMSAISNKDMSFLGMNILTRIGQDVWIETAEQATFLANLLLFSLFSSSGSLSPVSAPGLSNTVPRTPDTINGLRSVAINVLTYVTHSYCKPFALPSLLYDPHAPMSYIGAISLTT